MLKKLCDLTCKIDNSATITINLGDGSILKASPIEWLCIADEIIRKQQQSKRLICAESIYLDMLKALDIPDDTVTNIKRKLNSEIITDPTAEEEIDAKEDEVVEDEVIEEQTTENKEVKQEHELLFKFVSAFVNTSSLENEFEVEEFSVFGFDIDELPDILAQYSFETEIDGELIRIKLSGETVTND